MDPLSPSPLEAVRLRGFPLLLVGIGAFMVFLTLGGSVAGTLVEAFTGLSRAAVAEGRITNETEAWAVRIGLMATQVFSFLLPAVLAMFLAGPCARLLPFSPTPTLHMAALAVTVGISAILVAISLSFDEDSFQLPEGMGALQQELKAAEARVERTLMGLLRQNLLANLLVVAVFPAVCEELFFRGFLQNTFRQSLNPHLAIVLASLLFSLVHFQPYGFFSRWLVGAAFGYLAWWGGSLWLAMLAHFAYNGSQVVGAWAALRTGDAHLVENDADLPLWAALLSGVAFAAAMYAAWRARVNHES